MFKKTSNSTDVNNTSVIIKLSSKNIILISNKVIIDSRLQPDAKFPAIVYNDKVKQQGEYIGNLRLLAAAWRPHRHSKWYTHTSPYSPLCEIVVHKTEGI